MNNFVAPMLAKSIKLDELGKKNWNNYIIEPKHDGMRAIAVKDSTGVSVRFYGRSGIEYTAHVPHLVKVLGQYLPSGTIIDGELAFIQKYAYNEDIPVVDFNKTMRIMGGLAPRAVEMQVEHKLQFIIWDIISYAGDSLINRYWSARRKYLESLTNIEGIVINPYWSVNNYIEGIEGAYYDLLAADVEGVVIKNTSSLYIPGARRANTWYKLKKELTFDVVVMGFVEGTGKYKGMVGALQFGAYDGNTLNYVGKCSGMTDAERLNWTKILSDSQYYGSDNRQVIEIKCNDLIGSGNYKTPRHPQYVQIRKDKNPFDCKMEQFRTNDG